MSLPEGHDRSVDITWAETGIRVSLAFIPAAAIGLERELAAQPAGLRTHILVGLGACLFTLAGATAVQGGDPTRIAGQVATGVGFLGAGVIVRDSYRVKGLTTAASVWATSALGVAAGLGAYKAGAVVATITILALVLLRRVEEHVLPLRRGQELAVALASNASFDATIEAIRAVVGEFTVGRIQRMPDGVQLFVGRSRLPRGFDAVTTAAALRELPGVTGVDLEG